MDAILTKSEKVSDLLDFIDNRPDKLVGLRVCGNDLVETLGDKCDYICDGVSDEMEINQALTDARSEGLPVILMGNFIIADSIILKSGDCVTGFPSANISFEADLIDADLVMIEIQDEYPTITLSGLVLTESDKSVSNNDVEALIKTTGLGETGALSLSMTSCLLWVDYATGILSDCIQGYIQHSKIASSVAGKHGTGIDILYPYNLTLFDVFIGSLATGLSFNGDASYTNLIGCFIGGNTTPLVVTGKINIIGQTIEGNKFKNSGDATIANGQTEVTVTHGLAFTPTAKQIMITPTNSLGNAAKYYIDTIGATTFKIKVNADPGATTATFSWKAEY